MRSGLEAMNERFRVVGSRILIQAGANRQAILAQLQQTDQLPSDTSTGFDALVRESNPWISQAENERRWTVALQHEVERVLRQFASVKSAHVFLNLNTGHRTFTRSESAGKASVTLVMEGAEPVSRSLALAVARLVSGAVRAVPLRNVEVVDSNGVSALDWESEQSGTGTALHRLQREHERRIAEKIRSQFPGDPKLRVNVQVELDMTRLEVESSTPIEGVDISEDRTSEEITTLRQSGQPGVQPNVGIAAGGGGGAGENSTKETSRTEKVPGTTVRREQTPSGSITEIAAAINVSHSYLEGVFRRQNPPEAEPPAEPQVQAIFEAEKIKIVNQVTALVKPQTPEQVRVDWYYDTVERETAARAMGIDSAFELVQGYGPQAGLGLLALLSLGLMMRMARRTDEGEAFGLELGLPREAIDAAKQAAVDIGEVSQRVRTRGRRGKAAVIGAGVDEDILAGGTAPIGQAAATEGLLVAREVDERTVQLSKMVEQVAEMSSKDPESVAGLFEQWVQQP
ncbi:MAG: hypothetical protein KKB50_13765 [Planctomycetes bacterium]|nr:hypothetical protein [Planctomycetota bacterium]